MYTPKFYYIDKGPEITVRELKINKSKSEMYK